MRFNKTSEAAAGLAALPEEIAAGKATAQIGFYRKNGAFIGDFEALLYSSDNGDPAQMLADMRSFFLTYRCNISPNPGTTAARFVWFLLHERRYRNVGVHQGVKADIRYFYKISLEEDGFLEVFAVPQPLETSKHPNGGIIVWAQAQRDPQEWIQQKQPDGWKLLHQNSLKLIKRRSPLPCVAKTHSKKPN